MDRRAVAVVGAGVAVLVGIAVTQDDGSVVSEDGAAPQVVGSAIHGNELITADGTRVPIRQNMDLAVVVDGNVRVPSVAGTTVIETTDYTPSDVARFLSREPTKTQMRDLLVAAGIAIPAGD